MSSTKPAIPMRSRRPSSMPALTRRRLKHVALANTLLACLAALPASASGAPRYSTVLSEDAHAVTYNTCEQDASGECTSHELVCAEEGLSFRVLGTGERGRDTRAMAKTLIMAQWGEAKVRVHLAGKAKVDVPIGSVQVELNELNADWDLTLKSYEDEPFFEALTQKSVRGATVEIGGRSLPLASSAADEANLLALKKACEM